MLALNNLLDLLKDWWAHPLDDARAYLFGLTAYQLRRIAQAGQTIAGCVVLVEVIGIKRIRRWRYPFTVYKRKSRSAIRASRSVVRVMILTALNRFWIVVTCFLIRELFTVQFLRAYFSMSPLLKVEADLDHLEVLARGAPNADPKLVNKYLRAMRHSYSALHATYSEGAALLEQRFVMAIYVAVNVAGIVLLNPYTFSLVFRPGNAASPPSWKIIAICIALLPIIIVLSPMLASLVFGFVALVVIQLPVAMGKVILGPPLFILRHRLLALSLTLIGFVVFALSSLIAIAFA